MMDIEEYLKWAVASFDSDPADSEFQKGYLAALIEVQTVLGSGKKAVDIES